MSLTYEVAKSDKPIDVDAIWKNNRGVSLTPEHRLHATTAWPGFNPLQLNHFMGERPKHFPRVEASLAYDRDAIYVLFLVQDRFVRAVAKCHQDRVYLDSCVEFFFAPGNDIDQGYFNVEMNCGGTMLLHYQKLPRQNSIPIPIEELSSIQVSQSLPKTVEPELTAPTNWGVAYRVPLAFIEKHYPVAIERPAAGIIWRANFYKCADDTSHPHWLTWSPVSFERPDFHRPDQFGRLTFAA